MEQIRTAISISNTYDNIEEPILYSKVVLLFEGFLKRKSLQLSNLHFNHEKYEKLDGLLCEQIVKLGSHRAAFRYVFSKHGKITSQIWGVK